MRNEKWGKEPFAICHWDTFEEDPADATFKVGGANTLEEAVAWVEKHYEGKISASGADRVQIVDEDGDVVRVFQVT
jgi:hypothetical protein